LTWGRESVTEVRGEEGEETEVEIEFSHRVQGAEEQWDGHSSGWIEDE
jgi:hypothetical protein